MKEKYYEESDLTPYFPLFPFATPKQVGALIDGLASSNDRLWPRTLWPQMKLNTPLAVGAKGGHGPIGYQVKEYSPSSFIKFEFSRPTRLNQGLLK